jgi:hypothetical protein
LKSKCKNCNHTWDNHLTPQINGKLKLRSCLMLIPYGPVDDFCECFEWCPSDNLEYLEWCLEKKSEQLPSL